MLRFPISDGLAADIAQFITQCEFLVGIICREIERIDRVAQFALKPFRLRWIINIGEIGSFAHPIADEAENQQVVGIEAVIIGHINVQSLGTLRSEVEDALKKSRQLECTIRIAWKDQQIGRASCRESVCKYE